MSMAQKFLLFQQLNKPLFCKPEVFYDLKQYRWWNFVFIYLQDAIPQLRECFLTLHQEFSLARSTPVKMDKKQRTTFPLFQQKPAFDKLCALPFS